MTCFTYFKLPRVRITTLDTCGRAVTGCSTIVSNGTISVAETPEYEDREDFYKKNGDGVFCVKETNPPILKWLSLTYTFCGVDPDLVEIMTGNPVVLDDADTPRSSGYSVREGAAATVNFAFEGWTRLADTSSAMCTGGVEYGYLLYPWTVEGTLSDLTYENGAADFVLTARTRSGSLWSTGPYFVDLSDATATLDDPIALLTPINSLEHKRTFITRLAPPSATCGCTTLSSLTPS